MAEQPTKVETPPAPLVTDPPLAEAPPQLQDAAEKKPLAPPPAAAAEGTKALVVVENEKAVEPIKKKTSLDRGVPSEGGIVVSTEINLLTFDL